MKNYKNKVINMENKNLSRIYGKREFIGILNKATYSMVKYRKYMKLINNEFETNIMLAVTEVNNCQICNYYHTKRAIDSGISDVELQSLVNGDQLNVKPEEAKALLFAQHYASNKEDYSKETFDKVIEHYGKESAYGILGIITLISFGNAYGISFVNFKSRFTKVGKIEGSKLFNELFIMISPIILFPIALLVNIFKKKTMI